MDKPLMYIDQPDLDIFYRSMQQTYYADTNKKKENKEWEFPTLIGNVICEIQMKDETIRGEVIEEREKEVILTDEDHARRTIQKSDIQHVQIVRL